MQEEKEGIAKKTICVVGTGYIGFPLAILLASKGAKVIGYDVNQDLIKKINNNICPFKEDQIKDLFANPQVKSNLEVTTQIPEADIFVMAVPTPFDKEKKKAGLQYVENATETIAKVIKKGDLLIVESTVPPKTCRDIVAQKIKDIAGLNAGEDYFLAYCPERILPGNTIKELVGNDRVIGGVTPESAKAAKAMYAIFVEGELHLTDELTAEICKLTENACRDVQIAFANELSSFCKEIGTDVKEVIRLSNKHPRINILNPGIGVGGHCIPIDPWFLVETDPEHTKMIQQSRAINDERPEKIIEEIEEAIDRINSPKLVCVGMAYKPDVDDCRESPAVEIFEKLKDKYPKTEIYDPFVDEKNYDSLEAIAKDSDALIILVNHTQVQEELDKNKEKIKLVMKTPNIIIF